jgi:hypothetical protein
LGRSSACRTARLTLAVYLRCPGRGQGDWLEETCDMWQVLRLICFRFVIYLFWVKLAAVSSATWFFAVD